MSKGVLTMSDFPALSLRGKTDSEKLAELISYLPSLTSSIEREMMSLDFSNLNEDLQKKISSGITEHQDLSGYSSKNYTQNRIGEAKSYADIQAHYAEINAKSFASGEAESAKSYAEGLVSALRDEIMEMISDIKDKADEAYKQACTNSSWLQADTLLDRVEDLENKVG